MRVLIAFYRGRGRGARASAALMLRQYVRLVRASCSGAVVLHDPLRTMQSRLSKRGALSATHATSSRKRLALHLARTQQRAQSGISSTQRRQVGTRPLRSREHPLLDRVSDEARDVVEVEFLHHPSSMGIGRLTCDAQRLSDLRRRPSFGDETQHVPLAR